MVDCFIKTPRYVLKEGSHPTCPSIQPASADDHSIVIYGFSDKPEYDAFLSASSLALTPYPLVKGFLTNQIELDSNSLKLIVVDAVSPVERSLYAATFQSILDSFQSGSDRVPVSHQLELDGESSLYQIEASSALAPAKLS